MEENLSKMRKIDELGKLYVDIQDCHDCPKMDREKSLRLIKAINPQSDVFIISQALAANQLRKSGVNFFQADGHLGNTGTILEKFLNKFQRTVFPQREVTISSNVMIPGCSLGYIAVYNTEIAQCYPGKTSDGTGDRAPDSQELQRCVNSGFLIKELELIRPKLLLLMGKTSRDTFFDYVIKTGYPKSLTEHIQSIVRNGELPWFTLGNFGFHLLPIQHASGANPRFHSMLNDTKLIKLIGKALDG
jgi:uracil-DNA glycosylase